MTATLDIEQQLLDDDPGRRFEAPTGWTLVALVVALCFLPGAVGWTLAQPRHPGADSVDVSFLRDMRSHHESAIQLAQIELTAGTRDDVRKFADEIMRFQSYEIGLFDQLQIGFGHRPEDRPGEAMSWMGDPMPVDEMPGVPTTEELDRLRGAGADTDAVFAALMIDHHAGGITMAEAAVCEADDPEVRQLADRIARMQRAEIGEIAAVVERAGLDDGSSGVSFDVYDPATRATATDHGHD